MLKPLTTPHTIAHINGHDIIVDVLENAGATPDYVSVYKYSMYLMSIFIITRILVCYIDIMYMYILVYYMKMSPSYYQVLIHISIHILFMSSFLHTTFLITSY